jgi:hypothetical protein
VAAVEVAAAVSRECATPIAAAAEAPEAAEVWEEIEAPVGKEAAAASACSRPRALWS